NSGNTKERVAASPTAARRNLHASREHSRPTVFDPLGLARNHPDWVSLHGFGTATRGFCARQEGVAPLAYRQLNGKRQTAFRGHIEVQIRRSRGAENNNRARCLRALSIFLVSAA